MRPIDQLVRAATKTDISGSEADDYLRKVIQASLSAPQLLAIDGNEIIVISRADLEGHLSPKSAAELAEYFAARAVEHPLESLSGNRPGATFPTTRQLPDIE